MGARGRSGGLANHAGRHRPDRHRPSPGRRRAEDDAAAVPARYRRAARQRPSVHVLDSREDWVALVGWLASRPSPWRRAPGRHASRSRTWNATAPEPVTSAEFSRILGACFTGPRCCPLRRSLRLVLGEFAKFLTTGARVLPAHAERAGFQFRYSHLEHALRHLLASGRLERTAATDAGLRISQRNAPRPRCSSSAPAPAAWPTRCSGSAALVRLRRDGVCRGHRSRGVHGRTGAGQLAGGSAPQRASAAARGLRCRGAARSAPPRSPRPGC